MAARLEDENAVVDVIDDNAVSCFEDEDGNYTCADGVTGGNVLMPMGCM